MIQKPKLPPDSEVAANLLITLIHQVTFLLSRQIRATEVKFVKEGGYTERLAKQRMKYKIGK